MNLTNTLRHDWARTEIQALFDLPFNDLLFQAHQRHRTHFPPNQIQLSTLLSVKTGACPEDCSYCPQSVRFKTDVASSPLLPLAEVETAVQAAKAAGASRFCMGAAWRSPKDKDLAQIEAMIGVVKAAGMESCVTLGMLKPHQAVQLRAAGLDYYNHNIDTSPEHYAKVISTRTFEDRLNTLETVREAGIKVCCGGIIGLNETAEDRVGFLQALANLPEHPDSVPINQLIQVIGTPLANGETPSVAALDFVRVIAVARIIMPKSVVRLSAGREKMSDEMQALCFFAGANSIFYGEQLLTTGNPAVQKDQALLANLGLKTA